jgi:hypothetical protein
MRRLTTIALLAVTACLHRAPAPAPDEGEWPRVRDANTRAVKLYDGLTMRALATATWESPDVRAARVERTAAWRAMGPEERAKLQAAEDADAAKYDEFTVSMLTSDRVDNDLDAPRSSWRVAVVAEGAPDVVADKVRAVPPDALVRTLYPGIGDFDTIYRVRFPRHVPPLGETPFTLRIAGPRGQMDFPFGPGSSGEGRAAPPSPSESPTSTAH